MTLRTEQLRLDAAFSDGLQAFLNGILTADWGRRVPSLVFIRDFEGLPTHAPFDIDALCAQEDWPELVDLMKTLATQHGLFLAENRSESSLHILVLDIGNDTSDRRHCYFEIQKNLKIPASQFTVQPGSNLVAVAPSDVPRAKDKRFPVPESSWQILFILFQALRKANSGKYLDRVSAFTAADRAASVSLASERYGFALDQLTDWLSAPVRSQAAKAASSPTVSGWRQRLAPFCVDYLFFLPLLRLDFFTLHGPDGVGKSTTCAEIAQLFENLPVGLYQFHHSEGWKEGRRREPDGERAPRRKPTTGQPDNASMLRRISRGVYRWLPESLKALWLWNSHFVNYNRKFTRFLYDNRNTGDILFADRYIYDVRVKYIVETPQPSWLVRAYYRLHCALVPKPRFGFVLVDTPEAIVSRKDELSEAQVTQFIDWIGRILRQRRMAHIVIPVNGRPPRAIACEIATNLLTRRGGDLIADMRAYVSRLESAETNTSSPPVSEIAKLREAV